MIKKTYYMIGCLLLLASTCLTAQEPILNKRALHIGDTLDPGLPLKILDATEGARKIGDFRGKWLILDFWETFCMACIASMPKYDSINMKYHDRLEIVMVTKAGTDHVREFLERSIMAKGTKFKFIGQDTLLYKLFPHRVIPHEVWLDPDGVVRAITSGEDVNEKNIERMLSQAGHSLKRKEENVSWVKEKMADAGADDRLLFRSVLKNHDPTAPQSGWFERGAPTVFDDSARHRMIGHVYFSNYTPIQLFYNVFMFWKFRGGGNINENRIRIDIKDSLTRMQYANADLKTPFAPSFPYMHYPDLQSYIEENWYCYDLSLPYYTDDTTVFRYVFEDLNRFFPIKARIEKRLTPTLVLEIPDKLRTRKLLETKGNRPTSKTTDEGFSISNYPMFVFMTKLRRMRSKPFIDETGIDYKIDIDIDFKESPYLDRKLGMVLNMPKFDENLFAREMAKYGIEVKEEKRWMEVLVIHD